MKVKGVIENFVNDEIRQQIYFFEWCRDTATENILFKYQGIFYLRQSLSPSSSFMLIILSVFSQSKS